MRFYRSQFWRLQKPSLNSCLSCPCFIGHNFGDYKNTEKIRMARHQVLSVTILETTKTSRIGKTCSAGFYRSQFWRLQKLLKRSDEQLQGFIGHNFGDYKNYKIKQSLGAVVLSVTILETTKTGPDEPPVDDLFYRSQFWRLQKPQMVSSNYTIKVRSYSA